jgi:hypothetical protein
MQADGRGGIGGWMEIGLGETTEREENKPGQAANQWQAARGARTVRIGIEGLKLRGRNFPRYYPSATPSGLVK